MTPPLDQVNTQQALLPAPTQVTIKAPPDLVGMGKDLERLYGWFSVIVIVVLVGFGTLLVTVAALVIGAYSNHTDYQILTSQLNDQKIQLLQLHKK